MGPAELAVRVMALAGAGVTAGFQIYAARSFPTDPFGLGLLAWGAAPFVLMFLASWALPPGRFGKSFLAAAGFLLVGATAFLLWDAFVVHLDPQSGLVFLFLPIYQGIAFAVLYGISWLMGRRPASGTAAPR